jgi:KDO2-lipid IV(A) lauroyltransferase
MRKRIEYTIAAALVGLLGALRLGASYPAAYLVARLLDFLLPRLRRVAARNLSLAFPELSAAERSRITDGVFRSVGRVLVALARFPSLNKTNIGDWISYEGLEHYQSAKKKGRGVLIATAHLGNWELSAFAHALMTEPMNVMVRPLDNPLVDQLVENRRMLSGNRLIFTRTGEGPLPHDVKNAPVLEPHRPAAAHISKKLGAARSVLKALKNNEPVGILIDQNTTPEEGVFIDFFGRQACAGAAFAKLAHHSQAPVIPGFALWNQATRRYVLRFLPEVPVTGDITADTQRIHAVLEQVIRDYPDQWLWIHRRWKTRPPTEPPLY